ncbi:hypothetical protein BH11CYA1_BH11CYA1_25880 [soil metagenome]
MPKTSHQTLFSAILSASLLLATAGSARAESKTADAKNASLAYVQPRLEQSNSAQVNAMQGKTLQGSVSSAAGTSAVSTIPSAVRPPVLYLDDLIESALHIEQAAQNSASNNGAGSGQSLGRAAKAFVPNYFDYRPSRAAAQAFLGSEPTNKPIEPAEDERSQRNKLALSLTATMMQIAKGLGDSDSKAAESSLERGRSKLTELIGKGQAEWVITRMSSWAEQVKGHLAENFSASNSSESDVIDQEEQVSALVSRAIARDQQISNIKAYIAAHDHAPTGAERSLTLASLTPNLIGPAAKLAQLAVERGTGGSRSKRLDDVLTLGLALQERINLLTRESELAVNNLERARTAKNDVLFVFSKDLIGKLGGP